jgi:uncharacterized protein YbbK (DUF523 family)
LGERVRYDGKEKRIAWIAETLPRAAEVVSICPEVGAGMPVPRPPIRIVDKSEGGLQLLVVDGQIDHTVAMERFIEGELGRLTARPVDGYIFKARSPSCGLRDAPQFASAASGEPVLRLGGGLWAARVCLEWAALPCVDESEVESVEGQARFLDQVQAHWRARVR